MKVETLKLLEVQKVGDTDEGVQAGIDDSSLPFVFELVSKQLYSNPIGSIVREITSNCFDSHIEAKVNDPVIISKTYTQDEGYAIEFKDVGMGLSPDRMKDVFMNYFSSTKRGTNEQIGGFGIGSKTPLAYADLFYITTIYDGKRYEYLLHKGETKPTLESLLGYDEIEETVETNMAAVGEEERWEYQVKIKKIPIGEDTEEHNGTVIKILIENKDLSRFKEELKFQLAYFDNVYFQHWDISNDYDIYEGKHFKFRSDIDQRSTEIHLCIGKVRYPIDFDKVKVPRTHEDIPIAVKFDIGELQITPSREALRYTPEGIKLMEERIDLAVQEILSIFAKQNPVIENLQEFIKIRAATPRVTFNKERNHVLNMWSGSGLTKDFMFAPLANTGIKKVPSNMFFMWKLVGYLDSSGGINSLQRNLNYEDISDRNLVIINRDDRPSSYTNIYIQRELHGRNKVYLISKRKFEEDIEYAEITSELGIAKFKGTGKAKIIGAYIKAIDSIVRQHSENYSDLKPTDEWVNNYKRSVIESTAAYIRKRTQRILVKDMYASKAIEHPVSFFQDRTGILIYGFQEDRSILEKIFSIVVNNKASIKKAYRKSITKGHAAFMVIQIAKNVEKQIVGPKKTIYWKLFFTTKFFKKIETSRRIYEILGNYQFTNLDLRKKLIRGFKEAHEVAKNSIADFSSYYVLPDEYRCDDSELIQSMLKPVQELAKYQFSIPLIGQLSNYISTEDKKELADYLKYKGFKLRNEFYLKDKRQLEYEAELKKLLNMFKNPQTNLLTYKSLENDSQEQPEWEELPI